MNVQADERYNRAMRFLLVLTACVTIPRVAPAQDLEMPRDPSLWLSLSSGYLMLQTVVDGTTSSAWHFGDGMPMRISVEKALSGSTSLGIAAMWIRAPLSYRSPATCGVCDAHAAVAYYGPVLRIGRDAAFYQLLEISAGVMQYGSFVEDESGLRLPPAKTNRDFAFEFGTGLGYSWRPDWELELTASLISAMHERDNLPGDARALLQHRMFRLALRVGY